MTARREIANPRNVLPLAYRPIDAAFALGVSRAQFYRMMKAGQITAQKLGGVTLIRHEELTKLLDSAVTIAPTKADQASIK